MLRKNIWFFIIGLFSFMYVQNLNAQTREILHDYNYQMYLQTLKTGCLLVELSDRAGIREKLVTHGDTAKLRRFDFELNREFNEIFSAFHKYYSFGNVYFFLKSETHLLREKSFHKMRWFSSSRSPISSHEIDTSNFLIGTFGKMERMDSVAVYDRQGAFLRNEPKTSFQAFVFRDMSHKMIYKKYFLHVRTILRSRTKVIRVLNANLKRNYNTILSYRKNEKSNQNEN
jgi:hypothetical protein